MQELIWFGVVEIAKDFHGLFEDETNEELTKRFLKYINVNEDFKNELFNMTHDGGYEANDVIRLMEEYKKETFSDFQIVNIVASKDGEVAEEVIKQALEGFKPKDLNVVFDDVPKEHTRKDLPPLIEYRKKDGSIAFRHKSIPYESHETRIFEKAMSKGLQPKSLWRLYEEGVKKGLYQARTKEAVKGKYYRVRKR